MIRLLPLITVRQVQRKREGAGQSSKKRKFISGKREGDWLLRESAFSLSDRVLLIPHQWKIIWRDGQVAGGLESGGLAALKDRRQWDNRMPFGQFGQFHRSLWFTLCLQDRHNEPYYQWDPMWALSIINFPALF